MTEWSRLSGTERPRNIFDSQDTPPRIILEAVCTADLVI
jgi:hypothetical protein